MGLMCRSRDTVFKVDDVCEKSVTPNLKLGGVGRVVVRVSDLGSKGPGFDPRAVPKSKCMFVNIYHY